MFSEEAIQKIHHVLSDYFSGSWANGTAKPFIINEDMTVPALQMPHKILTLTDKYQVNLGSFPLLTLYLLPRVHQQEHIPFEELHILPFHLLKSGRLEELGNQMISQEFSQAMLQAELADELFLWLEEDISVGVPKKLQLSTSS